MNTGRRRVFPQLFRVLSNLHECFYNSIETRRKCFLFLLGNSPGKITENEENLIVLFIIKTQILYTTKFTRHNLINQLFSKKQKTFSVSIELQKHDYLPISSLIFLQLFSKTKELTIIPRARMGYLTIRLRARVFYEQIVNEAQAS